MKTEKVISDNLGFSSQARSINKRQPLNDNFILTLIFAIGLMGALYILNVASGTSTVNSQGYTIEYSSMK